MLGVEVNPFLSPSDVAIQRVAAKIGKLDTFWMAPLGIHFGTAGKTVADPYFGGIGPARTGCINCGECMTGCRHGAKNTLVKNYLYLAESAGATVWSLTTVTDFSQQADGSYKVQVAPTPGSKGKYPSRVRKAEGSLGITEVTAGQVIVAAGALGTAKLLQGCLLYTSDAADE